jgi:CBS-domain-containing membrane protein
MSRRVLTIPVDKTIQDAGNYMFGSGTTYLAVVDKQNQFVGWLSQGDIIEKLPPFLTPHQLGRDLTPEEQAQFNSLLKQRSDTPVTDIMYSLASVRRQLVFFETETPIEKVIGRFITPINIGQIQSAFLRKLPVLSPDHRRIEGVLGYWMVVSKLIAAQLMPRTLVGDCMLSIQHPNYMPILDTESIDSVNWKARQQGWSYIVIVNAEGKLAGMTSIEQIRRAIDFDLPVMRDRPILNLMRPANECTVIRVADPLEKWLRIFADDDIGALPVVNAGGKLEGLLNYVSVLRAYRDYLFPS